MTEKGLSNFKEKISLLLARKKLSQREFAKRVGVDESSISCYLRGKRIPRSGILSRIAKELEVTTDYLLGDDEGLVRNKPEENRIQNKRTRGIPEDNMLNRNVKAYAQAARTVALHLDRFCDITLPYDEMIADAARQAAKEIERLESCPKCIYAYDGEVIEYCVQGPCPNYRSVEDIRAAAIKTRFRAIKEAATPEEIVLQLNANTGRFCPYSYTRKQDECCKPCGSCIRDWLMQEI